MELKLEMKEVPNIPQWKSILPWISQGRFHPQARYKVQFEQCNNRNRDGKVNIPLCLGHAIDINSARHNL